MAKNEIPEAKSLKWLAFQFPMVEKPINDVDRMQNCIHLYCENGASLIERQAAEIEGLRTEKDNLITTYKECALDIVKEFAKKIHAKINEYYEKQDQDESEGNAVCDYLSYLGCDIDDFLKEMVGEDNGG